jgi:hypothetical protein
LFVYLPFYIVSQVVPLSLLMSGTSQTNWKIYAEHIKKK